MPATIAAIEVTGTFSVVDGSAQLVLDERLDGHDTFLTGQLALQERTIPIRILTLDDVTVLVPVEPDGFTGMTGTCTATLHLPHGARLRDAPADLVNAARADGRTLANLDEAELRYALTFLAEATTDRIRHARIRVIVEALPAAGPGPRGANGRFGDRA